MLILATDFINCFTRWLDELERNQVLVMTNEIFVNVLSLGYLTINQINLLILDECHNILKDSSLSSILRTCDENYESSHPRVLGLTASIVNNKCRPLQLSKIIIHLERTLKCSIQTSNSILSGLQ